MSAKGTFYVDCDGGTLAGTGVTGNTVVRDNTTEALYSCTYTNGGVKTIKFAGLATEYAVSGYPSAIRFGYSNTAGEEPNNFTPGLVATVVGSVGQIFPKLAGDGASTIPGFSRLFAWTKITTVPATMFNGVSGSRSYMFYATFWNCKLLVSLPNNLFNWQYPATGSMFESLAVGDSALESIPADLFSGITGGGATWMFGGAFNGCSSLTSIPDGLFKGITHAGVNMFYSTFKNCTNLSGYIPASAFAGLIANCSPYNAGGIGMFADAFYNTKLSTTTCPRRTELVETGYEEYWGGRIACAVPPPKIVTTSYVQGFYDEINTTKQDKLESGVNVITTGAPDGLVVSITADHGVVHVHKEEIQIPVGSVENPTGWLPIWVE